MKQSVFHCRNFDLPLGKKTYIMGILNTTPDSFSDGGTYIDLEKAVERVKQMIDEGVDIIDIGGESTRPGFTPVSAEEEIRRVVPLVERILNSNQTFNVPLSIDTTKAAVAEAALKAGAHIINDIWGLQREPMAEICGKFDAGVIVMHNQDGETYKKDLMRSIKDFLETSVKLAKKGGVAANAIMLDPGIGFGKDLNGNLETMRRLGELQSMGLPVLLGPSRKSMIGKVLNLPANDRLEGTAAAVAVGIAIGNVDVVRVHDTKEIKRVAVMTDAMLRR
ncbi:dihydropteroate synthase [Breznakiellaceae bacterium SP9]